MRLLAGAFFLLLVAGCTSLPSVRAPTEGQGLRYEVAISRDASQLVVEAVVPPGLQPYFGMATGAVSYVRDLHVGIDGSWTRVAAVDTFYWLPDCAERGCRLRYRFALREAAKALHDVDRAMALAPDLLEAPASTWLLRPIGLARTSYRLHVVPTGDVRFATGLYPARDGEALAFEGDISQLVLSPYTVFGHFDVESITNGDRKLGMDVVVPRAFGDRKAELRDWAQRSATAVADYYGSFPVPHALLIVAPSESDDVLNGRTLGNGGASSIVWVGRKVTEEILREDWVLPHELVHMAMPSVVDDKHRWFEEGVATYVEGLARARAGELPEEAFWGDMFEGLPKGLPHRGDRGLDHTPTWGRRYWGGTLFCFLADMEIRRRSSGRASLADALRGIVRAGGNVAVGWSLEKTLATGDAAVGLNVLRELHQRMGSRPMPIDLGALWSRLGVSVEDGRVVLDDDAPGSALRRALTQGTERGATRAERASASARVE